MSHIQSHLPPSRPRPVCCCSASDAPAELRHLVRSCEPAVVFTSLTRLCVPTFADACTVDIVELGQLSYRISHGVDQVVTEAAGAHAYLMVRTAFCSPHSERAQDRYRGVITYLWGRHRPTPADAARAAVLARHGVETVHRERLEHGDAADLGNVELPSATATILAAPATPRARARAGPSRPVHCRIRT